MPIVNIICIFLSHEPSNTRALEGMQKMEAAPDAVETPPYEMEVEDIGDSEVNYLLFLQTLAAQRGQGT